MTSLENAVQLGELGRMFMFDIIRLMDNHVIISYAISLFLLYVNLSVYCSTVGKLNWKRFGFWFIVLFGIIPGTIMASYAVLVAAGWFEGINRKDGVSIVVAGLLLQLGTRQLLSCAKKKN